MDKVKKDEKAPAKESCPHSEYKILKVGMLTDLVECEKCKKVWRT